MGSLKFVGDGCEFGASIGKLFCELVGDVDKAAKLLRESVGYGASVLEDTVLVGDGSGYDILVGHVTQAPAFEESSSGVACIVDVNVGSELLVVQDSVSGQKIASLLAVDVVQGLNGVLQVKEATFSGFDRPLRRVSIAIIDNALMLSEYLTNQISGGGVGGHAGSDLLLKLLGKGFERIGHEYVEDVAGMGGVLGSTDATNLELVTSEGNRRSTVPVGVVPVTARQVSHTEVEISVDGNGKGFASSEGLDKATNRVSEKNGDDGRGGFVTPKAVIVGDTRDSPTQEVRMLI